jgi:cytochrome c-type biogenesis protein CcmH/NrfG
MRRRLVEVAPRSQPDWIALARTLASAGRAADAVAAYEQALQIGPVSGPLRVELARAFWRAQRWPDAAAELHRARSLGAGDPELTRRLAEVGIFDEQ